MKTIQRNILLNPGPATTSDSVKQAMVVPDICPREKDFGNLQRKLSEDLLKIVHGQNDYVAVLFAGSGTAGVESAICSAVPKNKKLLIVDNGAYGTRMFQIAQTYQISTVYYQIPYGDYPDLQEIRNLLANDSQISHLAVIHHETTTGMLNPIGEIAKLANEFGVETIVDAMSSFAGIPMNIKDLGISYLVSSSNKCIQGMAGLTFVIVKKTSLANIQGNRRSFYLDLFSQNQNFEKTLQMQFTPPVQVMYALRQAINEYFAETGAGRSERYTKNWNILYQGVQKLGFKVLLPYEQQSKILLAICEPTDKNYNFEQMHDYLYAKGFTIYPGKGAKKATFRLSVLGDLYAQDIKNFLVVLADYLKEKQISNF